MTRTQAHTFALREVAELEGPTWVHVPFSISEMSQIEEKFGSFSENPTRDRKEFLLTQAYHITWNDLSVQFSSLQRLSRVRLFATPCVAACQASLSITNSRSLLKLMSIESVMSSNHPLSSPAPPAFNLSQHFPSLFR